jgi:hypothetical protein
MTTAGERLIMGTTAPVRSILSALAPLAVLIAIAAAGFGGSAAASDVSYAIGDYARECAQKIAPLPAFDCLKGERIPITVDGVEPETYVPEMPCDRPSLLTAPAGGDGYCVPNSRALVLRDDDKAQISAYCRQTTIRPDDTEIFDEVNVIVHGLETGSTCWFQSKDVQGGFNARNIPTPEDPAAGAAFWKTPEQTASGNCVSCHDSDPFMYSPYYAQTHALPSNPLGKYANDIGKPFQEWEKPKSVSTPGNTCTTCHRIGNMQSCNLSMYQSFDPTLVKQIDDWGKQFPQSHWMPPGDLHSQAQWNVIYADSIAKLGRCCQHPEAPECVVEPIPGGG